MHLCDLYDVREAKKINHIRILSRVTSSVFLQVLTHCPGGVGDEEESNI